ncbi:MAG: protein translocase subunit SecD [Acidobacteriota bacterium]
MERSLLIRGLVIAVVVALAALNAYPPGETINLGLDLQGGMHLVLRVKTDDAIDAEVENTIDGLTQELEDREIEGFEVEHDRGNSNFAVTGVPSTEYDSLEDDYVERYLQGWEMSRSGDRLRFGLTNSGEKEIRQIAVNQARETIRNRIDAFGVSEPVIHDEGLGSERIVVQLPGVDDPERVKKVIQNTAFLELRLSVEGIQSGDTEQQVIDQFPGGVPDDIEVMVEEIRDQDTKRKLGERWWALERKRVITGRELKTAQVTTDEFQAPAVLFLLTREGGRKFGDITSASIGRGLSIVLDGKVMSVATIQSRITDRGQITGNFTVQEVQDLVTVLRSGALPAGLTILEERTVGPSLGRDSIEKGERAGLFGGLLVVLAMLIVYKLTGINAVGALTLNIVLVFGALAAFGATLTLPGIAGIVLTIGMAVDANVLVFERIREELRAGRTVKSSIASGFEKALSSILDANFTTFIAAIFLFMFGTGPIRGFAVTLSVGIFASVFTAVFCSRWLFDLLYARRQRVEKMSI